MSNYSCRLIFHGAVAINAQQHIGLLLSSLGVGSNRPTIFENTEYKDGQHKFSIGINSSLSKEQIRSKLTEIFGNEDKFAILERGGPIKGRFHIRSLNRS